VIRLERSRDMFMEKISIKDQGTQNSYRTAINNFENFSMEKYGNTNYIFELKGIDNEAIFDFLQKWINWNRERSPRTILGMFSQIKKYLYHRGIKLDNQEIKEELEFKRIIEEEMYPLTSEVIQQIISHMRYKQKTQFICQSSSLMRIGELVQLKKKHLILGKPNIIVKIPANIAKFKKGRTTFFSKEASKLLKPILRKIEDNDLIFGTSDNVKYSETNSEQILRRILDKSGLDMRYESNNRYMINTHSFRAFGITKFSRHDPNFTKKISGQKGYLLQYDRMDDQEKLRIYEKFEANLIIDPTEKQKLELKNKTERITELEKQEKKIRKLNIENLTLKRDIAVEKEKTESDLVRLISRELDKRKKAIKEKK